MFEVKISEQIQKLHFNELIKAIKGDGVVSGLEVTAAGGMDLNVSEGAAIINGTLVSFSATSVTVQTADSLYPRKDIVVAKSDGSIEVVQGVPDSPLPADRTGVFTVTPRPPDPPSESIILAEIWVPAGATEITSGYITDRRIFVAPSSHVADKIYVDAIEEKTSEAGIDVGAGALYVDQANKRVGIGTSSPNYKLDLRDGEFREKNPTSSAWVYLDSGQDDSTFYYSGIFLMHKGLYRWAIYKVSKANGDLVIARYGDNGSYLGRVLTLERSTGYVGIGTDSPEQALHVAGNVLAQFYKTSLNPYDFMADDWRTGGNILNLMYEMFTNFIAYKSAYSAEYYDFGAETWTSWSEEFRQATDMQITSFVQIDYDHRKFRIVFEKDSTYIRFSSLATVMQFFDSSGSGISPNGSITVEYDDDPSFPSPTTGLSWSGELNYGRLLVFRLDNDGYGKRYVRITFDIELPEGGFMKLFELRFLAGRYDFGWFEMILPFKWDSWANILPKSDNAQDLGSSSLMWRNGYFAGKVGIGTGSPSVELEVNGRINTTDAIRATGYTSFPSGAGCEVGYSAGIAYVSGYDRDVGAYIPLQLRGNPIRLTHGNVGININSPEEKLHVNGNVKIGTSSAPGKLLIDKPDTSNTDIVWQTGGVNRWILRIMEETDGGKLKFISRNDDGSYKTDVLTLDRVNDRVGICTASPSRSLHVVSADTFVARFERAGSTVVEIWAGGTGNSDAALTLRSNRSTTNEKIWAISARAGTGVLDIRCVKDDLTGWSASVVEFYRSGNNPTKVRFNKLIESSVTGDAFLPTADNQGNIGNDSYRWALVRAVTITSGDYVFENGWRLTEASKLGLGEGIALVDDKGRVRHVWN